MADKSKIEWTEATWNPIVGCSVVSPGCTNCYAMRMAARLEAMGQAHYKGTTQRSKAGPVWTGKIEMASDKTLHEPLRRKKPTTWFVNSMGDLFHEAAEEWMIASVFAVMSVAQQHIFQVLTKRSGRMRTLLSSQEFWDQVDAFADEAAFSWSDSAARLSTDYRAIAFDGSPSEPLPNVWLGVSTEDQARADERIPDLLATPAAVRFISAEPLLAPIDLAEIEHTPAHCLHALWGLKANTDGTAHYGPKLDWVIVGGESGPKARPMHPDWARSLRDQCAAAGVPFFFKQWGEFAPAFDLDLRPLRHHPWSGEDQTAVANGTATVEQATKRIGKRAAGRLLDGREHNDMPKVPS
jgi:protein gp37